MLSTLDADDSAILIDRINRRAEFTGKWISDQCHKAGVELPYAAIQKHRRGDCKCPR